MANITKEFLETALASPISTFEINSGSNLGDNYGSLLYTIDVTLKNGEIRHLLVKTYPTDQGRQQFLGAANMFQRELCVYNTLIPELVKFQTKSPIIRPPFPDFVYGRAIDYSTFSKTESKLCLDPLDNCIVMPDLRKTGGFRLANRLVGFDLAHCELVIVAQSKFHALGYTYQIKSGLSSLGSKFPFMADTMMEDMDPAMFNVMFDSSKNLFSEAIKVAVTDEDEKKTMLDALDNFRPLVADVMGLYFSDGSKNEDPTRTKDNVLRIPGPVVKDETPWIVALHGDCWLNNFLFRYDEETGKPLEVILVDLQMTKEGDPLADICYSIFTSTTAEFRKSHMTHLLSLYVETFKDICDKFGVAPPRDFNLVELQRRLHRGKIFAFAMCLMGFPIFLTDPKDAVDMEKMNKEGETGDFMKNLSELTKNVQGTRFQSRVVDVMREMIGDGII